MRLRLLSSLAVSIAVPLLAGCLTFNRTESRDPLLEARIAELEARLASNQPMAQPASADERLSRVEQQLRQVVALLGGEAAPVAREEEPAPSTELPAAAAAPEPEAAPVADAEPLIRRSEEFEHDGYSRGMRSIGEKVESKLLSDSNTRKNRQREDLIGKPPPQTRFIGPGGQIIDLKDLAGSKKLLLVFMRGFRGQVCIGCSVQTALLAQSVPDFEARNTQLVLVYPGPAESIPAFLDAARDFDSNFAVKFPILLDVNLGAVKSFDIRGSLAKPTSIVIGEDGLVKYAYVGTSFDDRPSIPELLAAVDAAGPVQ